MGLTAVVLTRNASATIFRCLNSLSFCDQILVLDDNSSDDTAALAKSLGALVLTRPLNGDFSAQRNFALSKVTTTWALFVDADEVVPLQLAAEITSVLASPDYSAYSLSRQDFLWGRRLDHGDAGHASFVRLAKVSTGVWTGQVHEMWSVQGRVGRLTTPLLHCPHQTVAEFLDHINHFSSLRALELASLGDQASLVKVILFPLVKFSHLYWLKLGFLDGMPGLVSAWIMAFYTFLVRGKLFLLARGISIGG